MLCVGLRQANIPRDSPTEPAFYGAEGPLHTVANIADSTVHLLLSLGQRPTLSPLVYDTTLEISW